MGHYVAKGRHSEIWTKIHIDRRVIMLYIPIHQGATLSFVAVAGYPF